MDLDEWEYLPDDGFLDYHEDGEKKIFPSKRNSDAKSVFHMNYFICPSPKSRNIAEPAGNSRVPNQLVPVKIPIQLEPGFGKAPEDDELVKEISKVPIEMTVVPSGISEKVKAPSDGGGILEADQDTVSQVFFKKMKENEFVDMKMDSPRSPTRGFIPQIDSGTFHFDGKDDQGMENVSSPRMKIDKEMVMSKKNSLEGDVNEEVNWDGNNNIWKWSFTGIGAICSFGIAAATICILFFGSQQRNNKQEQNQKLRFQIYTDDKVSKFLFSFFTVHFWF